MKSGFLIHIASAILFMALAVVIPLTAQDSPARPQYHHYKLIDMGTFGASINAINFPTHQQQGNWLAQNHGSDIQKLEFRELRRFGRVETVWKVRRLIADGLGRRDETNMA